MDIKIAFYIDVNVFSLSNLTILKADISKTSSERYRLIFIFVCRTSKYTHMQKINIFYLEVNYVHLALNQLELSVIFNLLIRVVKISQVIGELIEILTGWCLSKT